MSISKEQLAGDAPEQSPSHNARFIQQIQERIRIFAEAGCEHNDLEVSADAGHEMVHVRPLEHVHVDDLAFDLNLHAGISIVWYRRLNQLGVEQVQRLGLGQVLWVVYLSQAVLAIMAPSARLRAGMQRL